MTDADRQGTPALAIRNSRYERGQGGFTAPSKTNNREQRESPRKHRSREKRTSNSLESAQTDDVTDSDVETHCGLSSARYELGARSPSFRAFLELARTIDPLAEVFEYGRTRWKGCTGAREGCIGNTDDGYRVTISVGLRVKRANGKCKEKKKIERSSGSTIVKFSSIRKIIAHYGTRVRVRLAARCTLL